jgi:hypothetical protein
MGLVECQSRGIAAGKLQAPQIKGSVDGFGSIVDNGRAVPGQREAVQHTGGHAIPETISRIKALRLTEGPAARCR